MSEPRAAIRELRDRAAELGPGQAQLALLEEAVRIADTHGDADLAYEVRKELLWPAYDAGRPDVLLVHFAWCLAHADQRPDAFRDDVLWAYRWVASSMPAFPQLPRPQIEEALADMARRYAAAGHSLRPVHVCRRLTSEDLGDRDAARDAHEQIDRHPRDRMADQPTTELAFTACYQLFTGDWERALQTVEPILRDRVRSNDPFFHHRIKSRYLVPLVRLGRVEHARRIQKAAYPVVRTVPRYLNVVAFHTEFLAVTGELATAVRRVERHLPAALAAPSHLNRFNFLRASRLVLDRLRAAGKDRTRITAPAGLVPDSPPEPWDVAALAARLDGELTDLASRFDARNGNSHFAGQVAELAGLNELADRFAREGVAGGTP